MKVYARFEDKQPFVLGIFFIILFASFPIWIFSSLFVDGKFSMARFFANALVYATAALFFCVSIYMVYGLFKRPRYYKAKLTDKKLDTYKGKEVCFMVFRITPDVKDTEGFSVDGKTIDKLKGSMPPVSVFRCYALQDDESFVVDGEYALKIKEFNWNPKNVEHITTSIENKFGYNTKKGALVGVFTAIGVIMWIGLLGSIFGLATMPEYTPYLIISAISCGIFAICSYLVINIIK